MKKILLFTLMLSIFSVYSKVSNLSTSSSGLSLTFDITNEYSVKNIKVDDSSYKKINLSDEFSVEVNLPETEHFSTTYYFSVPHNAEVDLKYSKNNIISFRKNELIQCKSSYTGASGIVALDYKKLEYRDDIENEVVEVEYVGKIRGHNLYRLTYSPLIFRGENAELITKVNVSLKFNKLFTNIPSKKIPAADKIEEKILNLNFSKVNPYFKSKQSSSTFLDKNTMWLKLKIGDEGIYRVTGSMISDRGVSIASALTSKIKVYSSAGDELSLDPADPMFHGAVEIARDIVDTDGDGLFESNDYIEFYAQGNHSWKRGSELEHYYNKYSDHSFYWIDLGIGDLDDGKEVEELNVNAPTYTEVNSFNRFYFYENRDQVLYSEYKHNWYTKLIYPLQSVTYQFPMKNIDISEPITLKILHANIYPAYASMKYKVNDMVASEYSSTMIDISTELLPDYFISNQINSLTLSNLSTSYKKYFNGFEIHYKGSVNFSTDNEYFVAALDTSLAYRMNLPLSTDHKLFDITDPYNVKSSQLSNDYCMINPIDSINHFLLWNGEYRTPQNIELLDYSDKASLNSEPLQYDMVIISPEEFYETYSNPNEGGLIEAHLSSNDPVNSIKVVKIEDINNEFGRGYQEPSATRNFIKFAYDNWGSRFFILGGDGNYNYKGYLSLNEKNMIFPSEIINSYGTVAGHSGSDDFYANLESEDPAFQNVAIGRFTVSNSYDLESLIEKTVSHINNDNLSSMNTRLLLVADDERNPDRATWRETVHVYNTENIIAPRIPSNIFTDKLFMTEYPFEYSTSTGLYLKPRAADELIRKLDEGVNLFIYVGHGAPNQLAHEKILTTSNYALLNNYNKYFFQIGATCSFGVFNDPSTKSLPEKMLYDRNKGSIGLINAVSPVNISANENFVARIIEAAFVDSLNKLTVGEALMEGKLLYPGTNSAAYMLLGDPALKFFKDKEIIDAPDSVRLVTLKLDTLVTELNTESVDIQNRNGIMNTLIIDSERKVKYFNDDQWIPYDPSDTYNTDDTLRYTLPGKVILSALSTISDGISNTEFILPKDLTYGENKGKILYYGYNSDREEFSGYTENVSIVGESEDSLVDSIPPQLSILFNSLNYVDGDPIGSNVTFYIKISDENGVNTSGGIGHKIMLEIDGDQIELNDYFQYDLDTYKSGYAKYQLFNISAGNHIVKASAWDTSNNYNEVTDEFKVEDLNDASSDWVGNLLNYPNPMKGNGTTFGFNTYAATSIQSYTISVYTVNGRKIKVLDDCPVNISNSFQYCEWDGKDDDGDIPANGVYIYILRLKFDNNKVVTKKGKLIFAR